MPSSTSLAEEGLSARRNSHHMLLDEAIVTRHSTRLFLPKPAALKTTVSSGAAPNIPALPEKFRHSRSELGRLIYGDGWGIQRGDSEAQRKAVLRNFEFFGAPVGVIVCMSKELPGVAAMSVGMYLQTFLLALTELGVGSCVQVSIAGYRDLVRKELGVAEDLEILCGVSVGYEDADFNVNKVRIGRYGVEDTTVFVKD
ncbi:hypothetical protein SCUP515_10652 [Seiridium cupressi]